MSKFLDVNRLPADRSTVSAIKSTDRFHYWFGPPGHCPPDFVPVLKKQPSNEEILAEIRKVRNDIFIVWGVVVVVLVLLVLK